MDDEAFHVVFDGQRFFVDEDETVGEFKQRMDVRSEDFLAVERDEFEQLSEEEILMDVVGSGDTVGVFAGISFDPWKFRREMHDEGYVRGRGGWVPAEESEHYIMFLGEPWFIQPGETVGNFRERMHIDRHYVMVAEDVGDWVVIEDEAVIREAMLPGDTLDVFEWPNAWVIY